MLDTESQEPWRECVIDASMRVRDEAFCFCPIEGDIDGEFSVVTGFNYLGKLPPEYLSFVAVIHEDGPEAAERFCIKYKEALDRIRVCQRDRNAAAWKSGSE